VSLSACDGSLIYVTLPPPFKKAQPQIHELRQKSIMKRLWTGLLPTVLRGDEVPYDGVQLSEIHTFEDQKFIFTLCKDLKLRIWSCQSLECTNEYDLTPLLPDILDVQSGIAQAHIIRKAMDEENENHYIAVFLSFHFQSQFFVFELDEDDGEIDISLLSSNFSKLTSLLDFWLTNQYIWALWTSGTGENILQFACIEESEGNNTAWQEVPLQSSDNSQLFVHLSTEPKDIYLSNLFMPGRFSKNILLRTIQMTAKSFDEHLDLKVSANSTINEIRAAVEYLVDYEFNDLVLDNELDEEDYYSLQSQCWVKFYASVIQFDQAERKPIGLYADADSGLLTILRQNYRGYLVPNTWAEWLCHQVDPLEEQTLKYLHDQAGISDPEIAGDVLALIECIKLISTQFTQNTFSKLESSISSNDDVNEIFSALAKDLFTDASGSVDVIGDATFTANVLRTVQLTMKDRQNLLGALQLLMDAVDPVRWLPVGFEDVDEEVQVYSMNSSHSFSSKEGRTILTESIYTRALSAMKICRDCLLLVNVLLCMGTSAGIFDDKRAMLESRVIPRLHALLRAFFTIVWLRRSTFSIDDADMMENSLKKFAALELFDGGRSQKKSRWDDLANNSILSCFVNDIGIKKSLDVFGRLPAQPENALIANRPWSYDVTLISNLVFRSLWPCRDGTMLPEFILSQGQASLLSEYLFICSDWCDNNRGSREFLMGQAFLQSGDHEKARQHFFKATKFIGNGEELLSRLIPSEQTEKPKMIISYFIMIMRLFEQFDNPEMVIVVATAAIFLAKNSKSTEVAMLWSNIFKSHLKLGHIKDAYQAIVLNPDRQRRRNCLNNFVVTLCERKQFQELCNFSYSSMEDEVVKIIETRARTVDVTVNDYYDILYAFHSFRGDVRRAATVMYEYACRLRTEMHGLSSLQQQAKCYLAAINSLQICDRKYAWIVRPSEKQTDTHEEEESFSQGRSPKRKEDGEEVSLRSVDHKKGTKKTVIVELSDLEKEYLLVVARLNLLQFDKNASTVIAPNLSPMEILPLLSQAGLFDRAFAVAIAFKIDLSSIFEGIAAKCVRLASDVAQRVLGDNAFDWLATNDVGIAASITDVNAVEQAWRLLKHYLAKFTSMNGPIYHKAVATKLLSLSCSLPTWFVNDYKEKNAPELLRIYISFDLLEEAGELAVAYIDAVLGIGKESFGIQHAVHANAPAVWLPYSALDQLVTLLQDNQIKANLSEVHQNLTRKLEQYFDIVEEVSNDKINLAYRSTAMVSS